VPRRSPGRCLRRSTPAAGILSSSSAFVRPGLADGVASHYVPREAVPDLRQVGAQAFVEAERHVKRLERWREGGCWRRQYAP
jgi:hypothetical protein